MSHCVNKYTFSDLLINVISKVVPYTGITGVYKNDQWNIFVFHWCATAQYIQVSLISLVLHVQRKPSGSVSNP